MLKSFARVSCNCLTQMSFHRIFINFVQGLGYMPTVGPTLSKTNSFPTCFSLGKKSGNHALIVHGTWTISKRNQVSKWQAF